MPAAPAAPGGIQRAALSPTEFAQAIGASRAWVYRRLDDGTIPSVKVAGKRLIRAEVLDELLAQADAS